MSTDLSPWTGPGTAVLLIDLQNDFLHPDGAYGRAGVTAAAIAALPARLAPLLAAARARALPVVSTHFTLLPGPDGEPMIKPALKRLRPFLAPGDFAPCGWGHQLIEELQPASVTIPKVAYSAFYQAPLEFALVALGVRRLAIAGIVTNGGVASTLRDAHVRGIETLLLADGCAAFDPDIHDATVKSLGTIAVVGTCEQYRAALETH